MTGPSWVSRVSSFARSFLIQGSWNNRTMIGGGFAFAILPILRQVYRGDPVGFTSALQRHSEHFNSHPYLSSLALGAVSRMEEDGHSPEEIRRLKQALRGPLGSLGDALIWVGWRPATVLAALTLALSGASPGATVAFFLVVYNAGHLALRIWGYRAGRSKGGHVASSLRAAAFPKQADRLAGIGVFFLGGVAGLALDRSMALGGWPFFLLAATGGTWGLWLGSLLGDRGWRWIMWGISGVLGLSFLVGWIG